MYILIIINFVTTVMEFKQTPCTYSESQNLHVMHGIRQQCK